MKIIDTHIPDIKLIQPTILTDSRGFFYENIHAEKLRAYGIHMPIQQENISRSAQGTLRGLHYQIAPHAQSKWVHVVRGHIFDVAVDIRCGSPTYGQWEGYDLSAENGHQFYVPVGFAHGFVTLEPDSEIVYKCTDYYAPETEGAVRWDSCGIEWPLSDGPILSDKDVIAPALADFNSPFIYGENA